MQEKQTTTLQIELPTSLAAQAQKLVEAGWFRNLDELLQDALRRFLESHRQDLMEEFIRQDVEWGLGGDE
jgi:Arc/MetJ-type ribon-helix-helix transcriptional regulator